MRLFLSSFNFGDQPEKLLELTQRGGRFGVIVNALDYYPEDRLKYAQLAANQLTTLGLEAEELDLRDFFDEPKELAEELSALDGVWVTGGNTFVLRLAMQESGFDVAIKELLEVDEIVYAGFSAGVVVLHPDLHGLEKVDSTENIPEGYPTQIEWSGLNILDYRVAVHYQSDHPESHLVDEEVAYYEANNIPYKTLRDGEVIIMH